MDEEKEEKQIGLTLVIVFIVIVVGLAIASCTRTVYVEKPVTHTEYIVQERVDSLVLHDSVFVSEKTKNDTIYITKYELHYKDRVVEHTDTVFRTDSISYPVEVVKTEYRTRGIVKFMAWFGLGALVLCIGILLYKFRDKFSSLFKS